MTLSKLAELAGVSVSTVSKAFSERPDVGKETRERIFSIAKEQGCFDKYNKNKFQKKIIAVLCPELGSDHYSSTINCLMKYIEKAGAMMTLSVTNFDASREQELYTYYSAYGKADGIIMIGLFGDQYGELLVPTVVMESKQKWKEVDKVYFSSENAMHDALSALKALGHTEIGFAGESLTKSKQKIFQSAARELAISMNESSIKTSQNRFEDAGEDCVRAWLDEGTLPTAIVAAYDDIAIGVMKELYQNGYRVPEDVSVVGMDDITVSTFLEPSLSSIHFPKEEICREAVALIIKKIENQYYRSRHTTVIPTRFIPRDSIAKNHID
jgi:DNA-binding LacI/PurR family transcriptional regulator